MPFIVDVQCGDCDTIRSVWLDNREASLDNCDSKCPKCGSEKFERIIGHSAYLRSNDPEVRSSMLKRRSEDHSRAHFKDNLERVKTYAKKKGVNL